MTNTYVFKFLLKKILDRIRHRRFSLDIDKRIGSFSHNRNSVISELSESNLEKFETSSSSSSLDENHMPEKKNVQSTIYEISYKQNEATLGDFEKKQDLKDDIHKSDVEVFENIRTPDLINRRFSMLDRIEEKIENH
jgi:hypothetical protein